MNIKTELELFRKENNLLSEDNIKLQEENENLKIALANARNSHATLCRGIKKALGFQNWTDFGNELFAEAVVKLLQKEVDKLRSNCTN